MDRVTTPSRKLVLAAGAAAAFGVICLACARARARTIGIKSTANPQISKNRANTPKTCVSQQSAVAAAVKHPLRERIRETVLRAGREGALVPLGTAPHIVAQDGVNFVISALDVAGLRKKPKLTGGKGAGGEKEHKFNPFLKANIDPRLLVVDSLDAVDAEEPILFPREHHRMILNKFPVVQDHALLVTKEFVPQTDRLDVRDFAALRCCVSRLHALAFFNCGPASGASVRHKHMQVIPIDILSEGSDGGFGVPVDVLVKRAVAEQQQQQQQHHTSEDAEATVVTKILQLEPFDRRGIIHAVSHFPEGIEKVSASTMCQRYENILRSVGIPNAGGNVGLDGPSIDRMDDPSFQSYNFILTPNWMMVVLRKQDATEEGVFVNSLGFAGYLLTKTDAAFEYLMNGPGPMEALSRVAAVVNE